MAYFSNGSEGDKFNCNGCVGYDKPCIISYIQFEYNDDQLNNPKLKEVLNMLINQDGTCNMLKMFKELKVKQTEKLF